METSTWAGSHMTRSKFRVARRVAVLWVSTNVMPDFRLRLTSSRLHADFSSSRTLYSLERASLTR